MRCDCVCFAGNTIIGEVQRGTIERNVVSMVDIENGSVNQFFLQTDGGLYLFSEPVPNNGTLFQIRSFGYFNDENFRRLLSSSVVTTAFNARILVVVFRYEAESGSYQLVHGPQEHRHVLKPANLTVEWPVQSGDLVGALIPSSCVNETRSSGGIRFICPSHIDLRTDPLDCSSALYYPFDMNLLGLDSEDQRSIPDDEFIEVQVHLNMEVSISQVDGM